MHELDEEKCAAIVRELVNDEGKQVFSLGCESYSPGGGMSISVCCWHDYYWLQYDDSPLAGPFETLGEALSEDGREFALASLDRSVKGVECTELTAEQLATELPIWQDDGTGLHELPDRLLTLNGVPYLLTRDGRLLPR
jgi:hypothetical protein